MMDSYSAFKEVLADQHKWDIFSIFLERDQSSENGIFYMKVEKFKNCATCDEAQKIYDAHLRPNSKQQINIDASLSAKIYQNIQSSMITSDLFQEDFDIFYKEKNITGTNYGLMKAELTELIDADPLTILSWLVSFNQEKKEWDRQFVSGSVEQVISKNTFVCKLSFSSSSMAMLLCWSCFDDGSIILLTVDLNHNKIESTDPVSYDKEKVLAYYLQPCPNKQSKLSIFLKQKISAGGTLPKEEMIVSSRCDQIKKLSKHLRAVWKGKYKGPLPVAVGNLFQFPPPHLAQQHQQQQHSHQLSSNSVGISLNTATRHLSDSLLADKSSSPSRVRTISLESNDKIIRDTRDTTSKDSSTMSLADSRSQKDVSLSTALPEVETRAKSKSKSIKSRRMEESHDQLHDITSTSEKRINDLEKENESLKQQIAELKKIIARYENK